MEYLDDLSGIGLDTVSIERCIANIAEPLLVVMNFRLADCLPPVSFAFDFSNEMPDGPMQPKYWCTYSELQPIAGNMPRPFPGYNQFELNGRTFFPFSAAIQDFNFSPPSIKELLGILYSHVRFEQ